MTFPGPARTGWRRSCRCLACTPSGSPGTAAWSSPALAPPPTPVSPPSRPGTPNPVDIPADDLDALGLRPLPREISVILADPVLRAAVGGLRQISAPVDELAGLQIRPDAILIVENKEPALAWSDTAGLVVIHSLGNHLDVLSRLPWIRHDHCWYWGDRSTARLHPPLPRPQHDLTAQITANGVGSHRGLPAAGRRRRPRPVRPTRLDADPGGSQRTRRAGAHRRKYLRIEQERILVSDASTPLRRPGISWRLISPRSRATASRRTCAARR